MISKRMKKDNRLGIPVKYTREIILKMFDVDVHNVKENYKTRFVSIFKNLDPKNISDDHVPYLSYSDTLEENLPSNLHFLNQSGLQAIKELLWLLYSVVPNIEFCPLLIKLISFSLVFMTKEETFSFIKNLMITDYSIKKDELNNIRFRLRFNYEENKRLIPSFLEAFKTVTYNTGKEINSKFEKIGFDIEILIEDMFFTIFLGYFNFSFLTRIYLLFLHEGSKILFRVAYAIFKLLKNDILEISTNDIVITTIKAKCFEMKDVQKFFTTAFNFKLTHKNNKYTEIKIIETFKHNKICNYYIPSISGESNIMTDNEIFMLWSIFRKL